MQVTSQKLTKTGEHLQLKLLNNSRELNGIAWRWHHYYPLPPVIDIAYKLNENEWNGNKSIQLEIIGVKESYSNANPQ